MAKLKICGLRRRQDIEYVNLLQPDYVGFILSGGFRRSIDTKTAVQLKVGLSENIQAVGVFVNEPLSRIEAAVHSGAIDFVQLHGNESPEFCARIKAPVIKALKPCAFGRVLEYEPFVDYFLFDSGTGTGRAFDWSLIPKTEKPFFLAGGLCAENLAQAVSIVRPFAVDISSGVETNGVKDFEKIKTVTEIIR